MKNACKKCKAPVRTVNGIKVSSLCPKCRREKELEKKLKHKETKGYQKKLRKSLHKKAWSLMSEWIRRKDADKNGINSCYTCGVRKHYKEMNAGHLYHNRLDLCADNLKCQCVKCNQYLSGNLAEYTLRLISEIGIENVEALKRRANLKGNSYTVFELEEIIQILQAKLKELAQN